MVLTALRGALGFLSQLPVGHSEAAWNAFAASSTAFPLAGYVVGALVAIPFLATDVAPAPVVAAGYLVAVVLVVGVNHADGLADLGDAAAVHGEASERREVMRDTTVGVGAVLALGTVLAVLALGALATAALAPLVAVALVVAAEVSAKLAMATVACLGRPSHEGFGATVVGDKQPTDLAGPLAVTAPLAVLVVPATAVAVLAGLAVAALVRRWAHARLDGVGGDVLGATNELARAAALHAGVAATALLGEVPLWTRW
ncbi:adenosylcobinamide-GDP ribazoletransferase [Haloarcula montana]|uniref:adenosylcobinamide-GDP ribazoletransferase n=1 Tax=Haloarcula montana TaxID=3111776 RepID=UPI002D78C98B|nr:adenosylcobinamide-GDP ribazoletransferase [Haloarcula sp. GH36]